MHHASKKPKPSKHVRMVVEPVPTRETDVYQGMLSRRMHVRYMKNLLNFRQTLVSDCNEQECPIMRQRLQHHVYARRTTLNSSMQCLPTLQTRPIKLGEEPVAAARSFSRSRDPKSKRSVHSVQTNLTSTDMDLIDPNKSRSMTINKTDAASTSGIKNYTVETRSYKDVLCDIIADWVQELTTIHIRNPKHVKIQENLINKLVKNILNLEVDQQYENQIKRKVDECLKILLICSSGVECDKLKLMEELRNKLWLNIKELNNKYNSTSSQQNKPNSKVALNRDNQNKGTINGIKSTDKKYDQILDLESCIENEIINWLNKNLNDQRINNYHVAELMIGRLEPLLDESFHDPKLKLIIKGEILEVLYDLSLCSFNSRNRIIFLNKCADELANKVMTLQKNYSTVEDDHLNIRIDQQQNKNQVAKTIRLPRVSVSNKVSLEDIEEEISSQDTNVDDQISTDKIIDDVLQQLCGSTCSTLEKTLSKTQLSSTVSVYTSHEQPITSTPKKMARKDIPKLNNEEIAYMNKLAHLIRKWIDTLPKQYNEDLDYKETIINDLAGDIMDEVKLVQLAPDPNRDNDRYLNYILRRWLLRFNFFEDLRKTDPKIITDFMAKLKKLPVPKLTKPQYGSRQAMKNIKHMQSEMRDEDFVPEGIDILEDQISVWMNEQPSEIYKNNDKGNRHKQGRDLALILQDRLRDKSPESAIENDINQWLHQMVKPSEREHIGLLTENLKGIVIHTPQDETLDRALQERKRYRADYLEARRNPPKPSESQIEEIRGYEDADQTMKEFINKFMEYNFDIDDSMAREAFSYLLKNELRKLIPSTRKELYENIGKSVPVDNFPPDNLTKELDYIVMISDWLKNAPIAEAYNTVGNKQRIDFVNDLAKNIVEIEQNRLLKPDEMNYDTLIGSVISHSIRTYELPVNNREVATEKQMVNELLHKIIANRTHIGSLSSGNDSSILNESSGFVPENELGQFIEQYVRLNGREIADDEVRLEAWSARLMKEVKKMIQEDNSPNVVRKALLYDKFADVTIPGHESVLLFGLELAYIKEISEWLKNFPLLPTNNQPEAQKERVQMISNLAEKMTERTVKRAANPNDSLADPNIIEYLTEWISRLPLDTESPIVLPIIIQQLINRIDRVNQKNLMSISITLQKSDKSIVQSHKTCFKDINMPCCSDMKNLPDPGKHIVETIENWCEKLPIDGDKEFVKKLKDNVAKSIYQKLGELNVDPRILNNDVLYREMLEDEIDTQLENIPQSVALQENRDAIKAAILDTIIKAKNIAKAKSAGENYKHKLEKTIDASIPNPLSTKQNIDPGFEIYKSHLANMFILENFDHGTDEIKMEYEKQIRNEIDKYFVHAQKKNAGPLSKDEIYNELYSALFKVPVPCGKMIANEVEEIKTRCEIENWFANLPLIEPNGVQEILDREKIIETLAKRIYNIEKIEPSPIERVHNEIIKWLRQLPFLPGQEGNIEIYAKNLQKRLESTTSKRKCVFADPKVNTSRLNTTHSTSQIAGPSSGGKNWVSPPKRRKPAQHIIDIVEEWCESIPLISPAEDVKDLRENITTKIIMKISELPSYPSSEYKDNDLIFNESFDYELQNILENLPTSPDFKQSIPARKYQLREMLKSVTPSLKDQKERFEYKEHLKNTASCILEEPHDIAADKHAILNDLLNEIVDNFMQYNYDIDDEARKTYKNNVYAAVIKYLIYFKPRNLNEENVIMDPLIIRNQLFCELSKIPIPSTIAIREEVEEIRMNQEVEQLFNSLPIPKNYGKKALYKQMKTKLSKSLNEIECSGHNFQNNEKMKLEIIRSMQKIGVDVQPEVVDAFINKLETTESVRKTHPHRVGPQGRDEANNLSFLSGIDLSSTSPQNYPRAPPPSPVTFNRTMTYHDSDGSMFYPKAPPPSPATTFDQSAVHPERNEEVFENFLPSYLYREQMQNPPEQRSPIPNEEVFEKFLPSYLYKEQMQNPPEQRSPIPKVPQYLPEPGATNEIFHKTYSPIQQHSFDSPRRANVMDQSLGGSEIAYEDMYNRYVARSSAKGPWDLRDQGSLQNVPASHSVLSQGGTPSGLIPAPVANLTQQPSGSVTPSSLFVPPNMSQLGNYSQFYPRYDQVLNDLNIDIDGEEGVCPCVKRTLRNCRARPFCRPMMEEFCEECGGFGPMWWGMFPGFMFY